MIPHRRPPSVGSLLLLSVVLTATVHAQRRPPPPPPDAPMVERWLRRACGIGGPADAAWGAAHVRVPMTVYTCAGELHRRCRRATERRAAMAVTLACEVDLVESLRAGELGSVDAWVGTTYGGHFRGRGETRRVDAVVGQFGRTLVMVAGADGEAILTSIDDR